MNIFHMTRNATLIFKSFITNWALHRLFLKASLRGIISIIYLPVPLCFSLLWRDIFFVRKRVNKKPKKLNQATFIQIVCCFFLILSVVLPKLFCSANCLIWLGQVDKKTDIFGQANCKARVPSIPPGACQPIFKVARSLWFCYMLEISWSDGLPLRVKKQLTWRVLSPILDFSSLRKNW